MLKKAFRLKKEDFEKVYKRGRKLSSDYLFLKFLPNFQKNSRFAFVVPIAWSKKATRRNFFRRRMAEIVRALLSEIKPGYDFIFTLKKEPKERTILTLKADFQNLIKKGNLWSKNPS